MTAPRILILAAAASALAACASTGEPSRYQTEMNRLETDCTARDGILIPTGATSGQPARDYACEIRGGSAIRR